MTKKTTAQVSESKILDILAILDSGEANGASGKTLAFFHNMPEEERRQYAKSIQKFCRERQDWRTATTSASWFEQWEKVARAVWLALLATATPSEIEKSSRQVAGTSLFQATHTDDSLFVVLSNRRPVWIDEFLQSQFEAIASTEVWKEYRRLYHAELTSRNLTPAAILGLYVYYQWFFTKTHDQPVRPGIECLRGDRELLEKEIWLLFDLPLPELRFWVPKETGNRWHDALVTLSAEGLLPRERLLNVTLDGLSKNYLEWQEDWLLGFHTQLAPTTEEQRIRVDKYIAILNSSRFTTAHFGLENLLPFIKAGQIDTTKLAAILGATPPLFLDKSKGRAKKLLSLFDFVLKSRQATPSQVTPFLLDAVIHENKDIQESAAKLLIKYADLSDPVTIRSILHVLPSLSPTVQVLFSELCLGEERQLTAVEPGTHELETGQYPEVFLNLASVSAVRDALQSGNDFIAPVRFHGMDVPRLSSEKRLVPVSSVRDLIDLMLWVLEHPFEFEDFERIVDGMARLAEHRDEEFDRHVGPIRAWFQKNEFHWPWLSLIDAWANGETFSGYDMPTQQKESYWYWRATMDRIYQMKFQSGAFQPLCTPTHRGGWIDPITFAERLMHNRATLHERDIFDKLLALFRLAPDRRAEALAMLDAAQLDDVGYNNGYIEAVRYALGAEHVVVSPFLPEWCNAPIWAAASRSRDPFGEDKFVQKHFPQLGHGTSRPARYETMLVRDVFRKDARGLVQQQGYYTDFVEEFVPIENQQLYPSILACRFILSHFHSNYNLWPTNPVPVCLQGILRLANDMNSKSYDESKAGALEILLDPDFPFIPEAATLLMLGFSCIAPATQTLAVDAGIAVIQDGRWDEERLIKSAKLLLPFAEKVDYPDEWCPPSQRLHGGKVDMYQSYRLIPSRWVKCFATIANESPLHAQAIRRVLERMVPLVPDKDAGAFLDLLHELCLESGESIEHAETRSFLASLQGSGKAAKSAKKLLNLARNEPLSQTRRHRAAELALQNRIERVKRWNNASRKI